MSISRDTIVTTVGLLLAAVLTIGLAGCSGTQLGSDMPDPNTVSDETTEVALFYSTGRSLLEERRVVDVNDVYTATLTELLLATPESNPDVAIVQPTADFNSVTIEDGVLTIDWAPEILDFDATDAEKRLARASFLATFGRFEEVEQLRFTVDGQEDGEVNGKDVQDFWIAVSLIDQPWDVLRIATSSTEDTSTAGETTSTEELGD